MVAKNWYVTVPVGVKAAGVPATVAVSVTVVPNEAGMIGRVVVPVEPIHCGRG